jgi:hypothetical protein
LTPAGVEASRSAAVTDLLQTDLTGATPWAVGGRDRGPFAAELPAGTLHVAIPIDDRWQLRVDGQSVDARPAFGVTTAFDVATSTGVDGDATLQYRTSPLRWLAVLVQVSAWIGLLLVISRVELRRRRRRPAPALPDEPDAVLSFDALAQDAS